MNQVNNGAVFYLIQGPNQLDACHDDLTKGSTRRRIKVEESNLVKKGLDV